MKNKAFRFDRSFGGFHFYIILSFNPQPLEKRKFFTVGKEPGGVEVKYLRQRTIKIFKAEGAMKRYLTKEVILGNQVKAFGIDIDNKKVVDIKIETKVKGKK